ncbi:MAG TPA: DUF503 domain-containing protein [Solirubrobacteraceae bacterium]|nr:DUF503 domain-containing protein [Solirubrobacteraceae bacterium]
MLVVDLHFPDAHSLKGKRKDLSSIKAQLQTRLGVAVAETDHHDLWQRATLTVALSGRSMADVSARADTVERFLERRCLDGVRVERVIASVDDLRESRWPEEA